MYDIEPMCSLVEEQIYQSGCDGIDWSDRDRLDYDDEED